MGLVDIRQAGPPASKAQEHADAKPDAKHG